MRDEWKPEWRYLIAAVALFGLALSLAAHIAALAGVDVAAIVPAVWALHAGIFAVFIPFVASSRKVYGKRPTLVQLRASFPAWVLVLGAALFAYALLNFLLFAVQTEGGNPSVETGRYVLQNHGHFVREITFAEYGRFRANEVRGFSGHWLLFYYVSFAYFALRRAA